MFLCAWPNKLGSIAITATESVSSWAGCEVRLLFSNSTSVICAPANSLDQLTRFFPNVAKPTSNQANTFPARFFASFGTGNSECVIPTAVDAKLLTAAFVPCDSFTVCRWFGCARDTATTLRVLSRLQVTKFSLLKSPPNRANYIHIRRLLLHCRCKLNGLTEYPQ